MRKSVFLLILQALFVLITGCNDDEVKQISKEGAIETIMNVDHLDEKHDIILTTHKVWIKNQLIKTFVYKDTIPTLGNTLQVAENADGDTKSVNLKKDYEVYITVK